MQLRLVLLSKTGNHILWLKETQYLGVFIMPSRVFKCNLHYAKGSFCRCTNAVFGRIGRISFEEVILQLINSKCIPMLICGIELEVSR